MGSQSPATPEGIRKIDFVGPVTNLAGIDVITSEYMPRGEVWMIDQNKILIYIWNDLVAEHEMKKFVRQQRKIAQNHLQTICTALEIQLFGQPL